MVAFVGVGVVTGAVGFGGLGLNCCIYQWIRTRCEMVGIIDFLSRCASRPKDMVRVSREREDR
jgi:hypothetical protein